MMKRFRSEHIGIVAAIILVALLLTGFACVAQEREKMAQNAQTSTATASSPEKPVIKNVIYFIGDGMGNQQRRIAAIVEGKGNCDHRLAMEKLPVAGVAFNHCLDYIVTDSAASGTSLACGIKTKYGMVGVDKDGKPVKSILELSKELGKSTGLITTVTVTHATPACFGAHVAHRKMEETIALQYLSSGIDVILGGGTMEFLPKDAGGKRTDGRDLIDEFKKAGYSYVSNRSELSGMDPVKTGKLLGLFTRGAMAYEVDRNPQKEPSIAEMTESAIKVLSKNPKGFFLMVEGGKIDWANHAHDVAGSVFDTIAMDAAVKKALEFAKRDPSTLIIVVNDHETGGMAITANISVKTLMNQKASAERIAGMIKKDGSNLEEVFKTYAGITNLKDWEKKNIMDEVNGKKVAKDEWGYGGTIATSVITTRTGIHFSTGGHTGTPAILAASGPGSEIFGGFYDMSEIPRKIAKLLGSKLR